MVSQRSAQSSRSHTSRSQTSRRRLLHALGGAVVVSTALAGCFGAGGSSAVDFEGVQSATIQIQAQGTFIDLGTTNASESAGRGSGFFIGSDGTAVTNNHVVTGAGTLKVWVGGDSKVEHGATILGASECLDLAVIKVDGGNFPFFDWHQGDITNGLDVYSAGFPLGDPEFTLTKGIVSKADTASEDSWASLDHVIEHDARIRGGNSGGPLVDTSGRVVGVNYAGINELDYNFAISRDQVLPVLSDLADGKSVLSLGINAQAMPADENGDPVGIWVASVKAGGPADEAGIEPGDLLTDMAGIALGSDGTLEDYCKVIETQGAEATIDVSVYRASTDEILEGQFNGRALDVTGSGGNASGGSGTVGSFSTFTDESGSVNVEVPDTWSDRDGTSYTDSDGMTWYDASASTDLSAFYSDTWGTSGASVSASPEHVGDDPAAYISERIATLESSCTLDDTDVYDDGYYLGSYASFTDCGGSGTSFYVVGALDYGQTHFIKVQVQMTNELDRTAVLDRILSSFYATF
jgi:serine protease Do